MPIEKLKSLPIGSKTTCRVKQWNRQHTQGRKIDQRSQQFFLCKLFGSCGLFCNKNKGIIKYTFENFSNKNEKTAHSVICQYKNGGGIPSTAQLTNSTRNWAPWALMGRGKRAGYIRHDSTRLQQPTKPRAGEPAGLAKNTRTEKLVKWRCRPRSLHLSLQKSVRKLKKRWRYSQICLMSCLNIAEKLELRKQI